jgi:hypothetical protein
MSMTEQDANEKDKDKCDRGRDDAFETLNKDQAEYDKQLLALSAAFLGVSLAFVKDVVPLKDAVHLWEFDLALGFLLTCVCLVLGTFQYSIYCHLQLAEFWKKNKELLEEKEGAITVSELQKRHTLLEGRSDRIKLLNWGSGVLFAVGVIFLLIFVMTNMHREAHLEPAPQKCAQDGDVKLTHTVFFPSPNRTVTHGEHRWEKQTMANSSRYQNRAIYSADRT